MGSEVQVLYRPPLSEILRGDTMKLTPQEQQLLHELADALREQHGALSIQIYGSAARGELEEGSDIDLFVILPEVDWQREKHISNLCFETELKCGRIISATCFSEHELSDTPLRASPLVQTVKREGVSL